MINISVVGPEALDFGDLVKLQREAFAKIIGQTGTDYLFDEAYYRWKYHPPTGNAKIALLQDGVGLVSANSMYPLDILADGARILGWQSCDTATHPRGRGKGYFMKCLGSLKAVLEPENLFFGFPNRSSMRGFVKLGWTHHGDVRTWARALPGRKTAGFLAIEPIDNFTAEQDAFSGEIAAQGGAMLDRGSAYMNWRYRQHPFHQYGVFGWREAGRLLGVIVLRRVKITGRELAIVMETLALLPHVERGMLSFAAGWAREHGAAYTLVLNNTTQTINGILSAYVPVPMWVLPKRQVLMGAAMSGSRAQAAWRMPWRVQIGDWDVF